MLRKLSVLAALLVLGTPWPAAAQRGRDACAFQLMELAAVPDVSGASDIVARTRVLDQPDSPLAIVAVDLSGLVLTLGGPTMAHEGTFRVRVKNVSDRVIHRARVWVLFRSRGVGGGHGPAWKAALPPGAEVWLDGAGRGTAVRPGHEMETELELNVLIESVAMAGCEYKPAQAHPLGR